MRWGPLPPIQIGGCGRLHREGSHLGVAQRHDLAVVGDPLARHQPLHDLEAVLEQVEARRRRREGDAERDVLAVEPRRAEREVETAVGDVVDRHRLGGEHRGVPVRHAGDEQAEADRRSSVPQGRPGWSCPRSTHRGPRRTWAGSGRSPTPPRSPAARRAAPDARPRPRACAAARRRSRTAWPRSLRSTSRGRVRRTCPNRGRDKTVEMLGSVTTASS